MSPSLNDPSTPHTLKRVSGLFSEGRSLPKVLQHLNPQPIWVTHAIEYGNGMSLIVPTNLHQGTWRIGMCTVATRRVAVRKLWLVYLDVTESFRTKDVEIGTQSQYRTPVTAPGITL